MEIPVDELNERAHIIKKCTWIGFVVNGILSVLKIIAGIIGNSGAMVADGVHSVSDFITDVIVIVFIGVSSRGVNQYYRYGHGKFETFATMLISMALAVVAIGIFWSSGKKVIFALNGGVLESPSMIALWMAVISIITKEWLYRYTRKVGNNINSMAVIANAWHHRSDALSSIATLIGISGAIFLGYRWRILDPIAAMSVSVFIAVVAYRLAAPAIRELLEISLPEAVNDKIGNIITSVEGVKTYHNLRTRKNGNMYVIDFHIKVNPVATVVEAHDIASEVEQKLSDFFGASIINVHIEPYKGEEIDSKGRCVD